MNDGPGVFRPAQAYTHLRQVGAFAVALSLLVVYGRGLVASPSILVLSLMAGIVYPWMLKWEAAHTWINATPSHLVMHRGRHTHIMDLQAYNGVEVRKGLLGQRLGYVDLRFHWQDDEARVGPWLRGISIDYLPLVLPETETTGVEAC